MHPRGDGSSRSANGCGIWGSICLCAQRRASHLGLSLWGQEEQPMAASAASHWHSWEWENCIRAGSQHQWYPHTHASPWEQQNLFGDPNSHEQGSSWGLLCCSPTVLHVMLLSGDKRLCVPKASRPIVLPTSWSLRFWLLRDLFKRALIQHSFVLHSPCLCRVAVPKRGPRGGGKHSTRLGGWQKVQRCSG